MVKSELLQKLCNMHPNVLRKDMEKILDIIDEILTDKIEFKEQDHRQATYAKKISKSEGKINWNQSARTVLAKINGLNPNPGAWFEYKKDRFKNRCVQF